MRRTLTIILLTTLIAISCNTDKQNDVTDQRELISELDTFKIGNKLIHVLKIDSNEFGQEQPAKIDSNDIFNINSNGLVRQNGDSLIFRSDQRTAILVNDTSNSERASRYNYIGYMPEIKQFLVHGAFYEWFSYLLIDRMTADTTYVSSIPIISPDKKTFVAGNVDLLAQMDFNGIEFYGNTNKPNKIGERSLNKWGPNKIKWLDNSTLLIEGFELDSSLIKERRIYLKLRIE